LRVAAMFAPMKEIGYARNQTFVDNFFAAWTKILGKNLLLRTSSFMI
jgi:hypothetical protein